MDKLFPEAARLLTKEARVYIVSTGAGAGLQKLIWDVPGISKVLVGAEFPYAQEATDRFLGYPPDGYCSERTAVALAMEAYYRAYKPGGAPAVGLGITASVASNEAHRGEHRVFVAWVNDTEIMAFMGILVKGEGQARRQLDGELCDALGLYCLLRATGIYRMLGGPTLGGPLDKYDHMGEAEKVPNTWLAVKQHGGSPVAETLLKERPLFTTAGKRLPAPTSGNGLTFFPGAFNPPHEAHTWLAKEHGAIFHITMNPPHKPALAIPEVLQRAKLLEGYDRLFTVDDPLYLDKAKRFPGGKFVVGSDAMVRMLDPKWGPDPKKMMDEFRHLGVRFLVADREDGGKIVGLDDIPTAPKDICTRIMRPAQHLGLSSTKLREVMVGK